jgi:hypothetical protein
MGYVWRVSVRRPAELLVAGVATALALTYLGLLLADFGAVVAGIYSNAEIVSAPYIGELYHAAPNGATVQLGHYSWYTTLWFELATRRVPFHRELWEVGPWIASLVAVALIAWATARAAGRWSGAFVASVLVCAAPTLLITQFSPSEHGATVANVCVLDALLVLIVSHRGLIRSRFAHWSLGVAVGSVTAAGAASDSLLLLAGVAPFVVSGLAVGLYFPRAIRRSISLSVLVVGALALVGSRIVLAAMHAQHVYAARAPYSFANWTEIGTRIREFLQSFATLFNADFLGNAIRFRSLLAFACASVLVGGIAVGVGAARTRYLELKAGVGKGGERGTEQFVLRSVQVTFWSLTFVLTVLAFILSNAGADNSGRYFVAAAYGLVVIIAVTFGGRPFHQRAAATLCACVVVAGSVVAVASRDLVKGYGVFPHQPFANFLKTFAQGEGLSVGYAAYWDAAPLGWETHADVQVYPVLQCNAPHGLCTYPEHSISSWYAPRPATKTFLIIDPRFGPNPPGLTFGGASKVVTFGDYKIYVYNYDIAVNFGAWQDYKEV